MKGGPCHNPWRLREAWDAHLHQNIRRTFFIFCFVSTNSTKILLLWNFLKKHWRMKNILLLGIVLIDRVTISGRRIYFERKKVLFLKNYLDSLREKFSDRRTYSLDPFYQHYLVNLCSLSRHCAMPVTVQGFCNFFFIHECPSISEFPKYAENNPTR